MRKNNLSIALGLLLLLIQSDYLFAYDEPDSFAGIKFGEDLTKQIKSCVTIKQKGEKCYTKKDRNGQYELSGIRIYEGQDGMIASQIDNKLGEINLDFMNYDNMRGPTYLAILKQKYGAPTNVTQTIEYGKKASWKGNNVSIDFYERVTFNGYGWVGTIYFYTKEWTAYKNKIHAEKIKKGASGL